MSDLHAALEEIANDIWWIWESRWETRLGRYICERWTGHSPGVIWYNVGGQEPDMRCKRCLKDIG